MKIVITKQTKVTYTADLIDLPGSPTLGVGDTPEMAVALLMYELYLSGKSEHTTPILSGNIDIKYKEEDV